MKGLMIKDLYNLEETIAADLFDGVDYPDVYKRQM